jgi:hypothetical protein
MAIKHIVTRGYGNGTFSGTIALVVTRGYGIAVQAATIVGAWSRIIDCRSQNKRIECTSVNKRIDT